MCTCHFKQNPLSFSFHSPFQVEEKPWFQYYHDREGLRLLNTSRFWAHHGSTASWVRISSDAFEVLLVYHLFGSALTFSRDVVVSRQQTVRNAFRNVFETGVW